MTIGIIGASGDLGSQVRLRMTQKGWDILTYSRSDDRSGLTDLTTRSDIIHVCAPVDSISKLPPTSAIVVLHDSVMNTSRQASDRWLGGGAAIVHMLMNDQQTVVVASDSQRADAITQHFSDTGYSTVPMTVDEHDQLMAHSQAPLALLCRTLLPMLYEHENRGLLTPSGQLLADTLRSREAAWTDATIQSILSNPQLRQLMDDMQDTLKRYNSHNTL